MKTKILIGLLTWHASLYSQSVPRIGTDSTLEVANWNLQWFGSTTAGPVNETLQLKNISATIQMSDLDVWGLVEVSDTTAWDSLLRRLPDYSGILSSWNQAQKTALVFKKNQFRYLYKKHPLASYSYDFAGGRLPLEVGLETNMGTWKDTLIFIVIHLKSNVGTDMEKEDSWNRRQRAAMALKAYVESLGQNKKVMVLGDWNDDLDSSVYSNWASPFKFWIQDTAQYLFPSLALSLAKEKSMENYSEMIDHQCLFGRMRIDYIPGSAKVFYLKSYITGYSNNTSDHYPVYSVLKLQNSRFLRLSAIFQFSPVVYYNGSGIIVDSQKEVLKIRIFEVTGREVFFIKPESVYLVMVQFEDGFIINRIFASK